MLNDNTNDNNKRQSFTASVSEWKGHHVLALFMHNPPRRPVELSLGLGKAMLIVAAFDAIKRFVETAGVSCDPASTEQRVDTQD